MDQREYNKNYYLENRKKILEEKKTPIVCKCGETITKSNMIRHKKSEKHQLKILRKKYKILKNNI